MAIFWFVAGVFLSVALGVGWCCVVIGGWSDDVAMHRYEAERQAFEDLFE